MRMKGYAIVATGVAVAVSGLLAWLGVSVGSDWSTFLPDLVVGIAGAGFISTVLLLVQQRAARLSDKRTEQTAAYLQLLERITDARAFRPDKDGTELLGRLTTSMIVFSEVVDEEYPALPAWFEAERQRVIYSFDQVLQRSQSFDLRTTDEERLRAVEPVFVWSQNFSGNVRLWRKGKLTNEDAASQAAAIEKVLRKEGAWREPEH